MKPRRYAQRRFFSILSTVADQNDVVNRQEGGDAAAATETDGLIAGFGRQKRRDGWRRQEQRHENENGCPNQSGPLPDDASESENADRNDAVTVPIDDGAPAAVLHILRALRSPFGRRGRCNAAGVAP